MRLFVCELSKETNVQKEPMVICIISGLAEQTTGDHVKNYSLADLFAGKKYLRNLCASNENKQEVRIGRDCIYSGEIWFDLFFLNLSATGRSCLRYGSFLCFLIERIYAEDKLTSLYEKQQKRGNFV